MHSFQKLCPEASRQLSTVATGTAAVILVYGVYSLGRIFVAGAVHAGLGAVQGLVIVAPPYDDENPRTAIDWCFDCMEHTGIFLIRKSVSMLREGFKNALSGIAHESESVIWPWCQFYKSFTPPHKAIVPLEPASDEVLSSRTDSTETMTTSESVESVEEHRADNLYEVYNRLQNTRTFGRK